MKTDLQTGKIDMQSINNKDVREVGEEWLCLQALHRLCVNSFLERVGFTEDEVRFLTSTLSKK